MFCYFRPAASHCSSKRAKGGESGRKLSVLLSLILLPAFPIGTFIGTTLMSYNAEWKEDLDSKEL